MAIFLFFFILILIIVLPIVFILSRVIGLFRPKNRNGQTTNNRAKATYNNPADTKKVFSKNEGEYVEFEEVEEIDDDN